MTTRLYTTRADAAAAARDRLPDASQELLNAVTMTAWRAQVDLNEALRLVGSTGGDLEGYEVEGVCSSTGCWAPARAAGLCATHYQQQRRRGETQPVRQPAAARIGVRLSAEALKKLGARPAERAREVLEAWAKGSR